MCPLKAARRKLQPYVRVCTCARACASSAHLLRHPTIANYSMHCNASPRKCDARSPSVVCACTNSCDTFMCEYVCARVCGHFESTCACISLFARTCVRLCAHASAIIFESGVIRKNMERALVLVLIQTHMRAHASTHAFARKHTQADSSNHTRIRWHLICEFYCRGL